MVTEAEIRRDYVSVSDAANLLNVNDSRIRQFLMMSRFHGAFKFADTWLIPREAVMNHERLKPGKKKKGADNSQNQ